MRLRGSDVSTLLPQSGGGSSSSSRKRQAPTDYACNNAAAAPAPAAPANGAATAPPTSINSKQPLVAATLESLEEMRMRVATVAEETKLKRLEQKYGDGVGQGGAQHHHQQHQDDDEDDETTAAFLKAFQLGVLSKVESVCDLPDATEQQKQEESLLSEIFEYVTELEAKKARLRAARERVARLSAATSSKSLRISEATEDRITAALEAKVDQSKKEREAGGPLLPPAGSNDDGVVHHSAAAAVDVDSNFEGIDASVLEPKVSYLIGKLSELPGPLKAVLQENPELTASLVKTVQSVKAAMGAAESQTEALLRKAPPAPLAKKAKVGVGQGAEAGPGGTNAEVAGDGGDANAKAKAARLEHARRGWEAAGIGLHGGHFS